MADLPYILHDQASMTQLGEFETLEEVGQTLLRYAAADPSAAKELEIWHEHGAKPLPIDPNRLRPTPAA